MKLHGSFAQEGTIINQYKYLHRLYSTEVLVHNDSLAEYHDEVALVLLASLHRTQPNFKLYENQPYITAVVRNKLIDFILRMAVRLKIVPFVFCKAVRLFDRYCSKRIVLLDQAQLVITTCLWIAAKVHGGNNHFANLQSSKCSLIKTILNLGFGLGARFAGPTERYRMPKISELVKLCGARCNYDANMFKQMELHIMTTLDWNMTDASIDDFLISLEDLRSCTDYEPAATEEATTLKTFVAYASCFLYDLIKYTPLEMAKATVDLLNHAFSLRPSDGFTLNSTMFENAPEISCTQRNRHVEQLLTQAVMNAPAYLLRCFDVEGPRRLFSHLNGSRLAFEEATTPTSIATPSLPDMSLSNYTYATPTKVLHDYPSPIMGVPYISKNPIKGSKLLVTDSAHMNSHHYPPIKSTKMNEYPQPRLQELLYRNNNSLGSIASSTSSKASDIFYDSTRYGVCTPISIDDEKPVKKRAS